MTPLLLLAAWFVVSVPVALATGALLRGAAPAVASAPASVRRR